MVEAGGWGAPTTDQSNQPNKETNMSTTYCRHVRTNGRRCRSAAMRGKSLCYFHEGVNTRKRAKRL